ncbi:ribonuclease H-like domain-containing protein [Tanacetum coccineum]
MWLFRHKYLEDGTLSRYKAHLVANSSTQLEGLMFMRPLVRLLNWVLFRLFSVWLLLDIDSFIGLMSRMPSYMVIYLRCGLFMGSSRPLELGFNDLHLILLMLGFIIVIVTPLYLSTDKGILLFTRDSTGLFLSRRKYAVDILERAHMANYNPSLTPVDTESKLADDGYLVSNLTLYRSLAGSLQYITFTRPDIFYAVQQVCLYMHEHWEPHFSSLKRILRRSTSDYYVFLGNNLLSWSFKRQPTLSRSSAEAEYRSVANAIAEACSLRIYFVRVLHVPSRYQYATIFTKGLPLALFEEFHTSLSIRCLPAPTAAKC